MSTTSMAIFSNPLFATYSVYARNASVVWLFWLSYMKLHVNVYVADDGGGWTKMAAANGGQHEIAINPHTNYT